MIRNVGKIDGALRVVVGILLIGLAFGGTIGLWGYIGFIPLVTGIAGSCPLYTLLGLRTCKAVDSPTAPGAR